MGTRGPAVSARTTPEYRVWARIHLRCAPDGKDSKYYADRGITVCDRWKSSRLFLDDMGPRPTSSHEIDRINTLKGYSPENCRWVLRKEQMENSRNSKWWYVYGVRYPSLNAAAEGMGMSKMRVRYLCGGRRYKGMPRAPKPGCWTELKYV